ncbi:MULTISPECIES: hypothetical protein [unclassified Streptomyces]|uniref:hypothetical protein n=1 Tax=unclassified Streptomyces TaxID=2593676 RepID=UPI0033331AC8
MILAALRAAFRVPGDAQADRHVALRVASSPAITLVVVLGASVALGTGAAAVVKDWQAPEVFVCRQQAAKES